MAKADNIVETIKYRGYEIEIEYDNDPMNPRTDWDSACTMCCWHSRYNLGDWRNGKVLSKYYDEPIDLLYELAGLDRSDCQDEECNDWTYECLISSIEERGTIIAPLYLYDHSGISISMGGYSCSWDSGQVGWVYIEKDKIQEEWNGDYEKAKKCMQGEVETYDDYLTGMVYRWNTDNDGCGGYYGQEGQKEAITEAKHSIDYYIKDKTNKHLQKLKEWIKAGVNIQYRKAMAI